MDNITLSWLVFFSVVIVSILTSMTINVVRAYVSQKKRLNKMNRTLDEMIIGVDIKLERNN